MKIIYTQEAIPNQINKSIFLAGPSLRPNQSGISWRINALEILELLGYDGVVFVPEFRDGIFDDNFNWEHQVKWETKCLQIADNILFHINRNLSTELYGLTTNDEWGYWKDSGKCVLSIVPNADKTEYQEWWAKQLKVPTYYDLYHSILHIINEQNEYECDVRKDGERNIPLEIWSSNQFKSWYNDLKSNGNWISDSKVLKIHRMPSNNKMFAYSLWLNIYIANEDRYKNNEFVFTRNDISSCVLYYPSESDDILDTKIVLVSEFRTPVSNKAGKVYEIPGGSSFKPNSDPFETIVDEISEECGFDANKDKIKEVNTRQIYSTLLTHKVHLYKYELDLVEYNKIKSNEGQIFGNIQDTERTMVHVKTLREILEQSIVDYSNIGQIFEAIKYI